LTYPVLSFRPEGEILFVPHHGKISPSGRNDNMLKRFVKATALAGMPPAQRESGNRRGGSGL
ncbi:MAG: hypothetical protein WAW37_21015, partial [Syntrophobacteraceae bacterium]